MFTLLPSIEIIKPYKNEYPMEIYILILIIVRYFFLCSDMMLDGVRVAKQMLLNMLQAVSLNNA